MNDRKSTNGTRDILPFLVFCPACIPWVDAYVMTTEWFSFFLGIFFLFLSQIEVNILFPKTAINHAENLKVAFALKGQ